MAPFHWENEINIAYISHKRIVLFFRQIELYVTIGYLQDRPTFLITGSLAVNILHVAKFINVNIPWIISKELKVAPWRSKLIFILSSYLKAVNSTDTIESLDIFQ